jgi:hypothetical protein
VGPSERGNVAGVRLLVLGGGGFLGHHVVVAAQAAGHEVTVFSRSRRSEVPGVEVLTGDRHDDLGALRGPIGRGRTWAGARRCRRCSRAACGRSAAGRATSPVPVGEDVLRSRLAGLDDEQRPLWYRQGTEPPRPARGAGRRTRMGP